jgi:CRISPR/Cas system-associated exonuclease Cas4 (RecB family)
LLRIQEKYFTSALENARDITLLVERKKSLNGQNSFVLELIRIKKVGLMRFGIEFEEGTFDKILNLMKQLEGKELKIEDLLKLSIENEIISTDYLFLVLQELSSKKMIESSKGIVKVGSIQKEGLDDIKNKIVQRLSRIKKIFFTPLEIAKFYECPRRLWLEKIVLSKQEKEKIGKVWDGEAVHLAIKLMIDNIQKEKDENFLVLKASEEAMKKYEGMIQIDKNTLEGFLRKFLELIKEENFISIYSERTIESLREGIIGSIDAIGFNESEIVPIEIKYASFKGRIKKEHLLQAIGESILVSNYFRREIKHSFIVYFQTNSLVKIEINENLLSQFFRLKKQIQRFYSLGRIPPKSKLPNYLERVCKGCHVKRACDNIELLKRIGRKF